MRHADFEVEIPLAEVKATEFGPGNKADYLKLVHERYTAQYLEAFGIEPNEHNKKLVGKHAPLEECEIEAEWGNNSVVASRLRIMQPIIAKKRRPSASEVSRRSAAFDADQLRAKGGLDLLPRNAQRERLEFVRVVPPVVPTAATVDRIIGKVGSDEGDPEEIITRAREKAILAMQMRDVTASEGADARLVDELEAMRRRSRKGCDDSEKEEPMLVQWGEDGERELEVLKKKFILPFAAEHAAPGKNVGTVLEPWQSTTLQANFALHVTKDYVSEVSKPISATFEDIHSEQMRYIHDRLPLELLTTRKDPWLFAALRERLGSPEAVRLTGLAAHVLYWSVLGHMHEPEKRLPALTSQSLVLTLQELWARLVEPIKRSVGRRGELLGRDSPAGICFVLPVFLLALKRGVEHIFLTQYRRTFSDMDHGEEWNEKLVTQLNILMMNTFDPDCAYANFGALDSSSEAIRLWKKLCVLQMKLGLTPATRMIGREFRTTPMVLLLMNSDGYNPIDPKTRKHLQKSSSDSVLATCAGVFPQERIDDERRRCAEAKGGAPSPMPRPRLDKTRRAALYRTAQSRFAFIGDDDGGHKGMSGSGVPSPKMLAKPRLPKIRFS
eukprot:TRINITY_DN28939_c0_g1_i1.p1 TRINITY_DN28939_c0_g1~~TRINITY_DN28939_c0_g1_i1.p1  ORF type:complete len:611 (-),score=125.60 TRINITY_DN28939_c0_g1_i1:336-2168(-)